VSVPRPVAPPAPYPVGGPDNANAKRAGWYSFYRGIERDANPFPPALPELGVAYREGWDAAQGFDTFGGSPNPLAPVRTADDAKLLAGLRKLCGYVEDGSNSTVTIGQDDATRTWFVSVDKRYWHATSFRAAIEAAVKEMPE
jgi:hypothetical protein